MASVKFVLNIFIYICSTKPTHPHLSAGIERKLGRRRIQAGSFIFLQMVNVQVKYIKKYLYIIIQENDKESVSLQLL